MKNPKTSQPPFRPTRCAWAVTLALLGWSGASSAIELQTGNPDLMVRWDNTVRVNAGWRVEERDAALANSPVTDEGTYKFDKGDMYNKRVDLLSELDVTWRKDMGFRVSGAAWYDSAYSDATVRQNPLYAMGGVPTSYVYSANQYSPYVKRFYHQGGEILDAFVFSTFQADTVPISVKAGRFTTYWGQAMFYQGGIASSQHPIDGGKAAANPGTEVRETFLPLEQLYATAQLLPNLAVGAQYYLDWKSTRAPEGGTYLGSVDFILNGPNAFGVPNPLAPGFEYLPRSEALGPAKKRGNWGMFAKYSPDILEGQSLGFYYREYDAKAPWLMIKPDYSGYRAVYARDTKLYGVSFDGSLGPMSLGAELGYHKNAGLNSTMAPSDEGARGNTWHALVNSIYLLPKTPVWDTGSLVWEVSYDRLSKVTKNAALFNNVGSAHCVNNATGGAGTAKDGCATKDAWGLGVSFTPQWMQVYPGVDLSLPLSVQWGIKGNSAGFLGVNEGNVAYSIGLQADIQNIHRISLTYAASDAPIRTITQPGLGQVAVGGNGSWGINDRGRLALTYKVAF